MTKLYKNITKNFAALRAALVPVYKSLYKLFYIKQLQQYYIVQMFVKTMKYILITIKYVLMFGTFGTVIWYALYFTLNYFEIPINIDITFLTSIITSILSVSIIEKLYAPIRTFITKLNANLLYKLMENPDTIESAKKLNKNIQILPKDHVEEIYNEVDHIERLQQQKADLKRATELKREAGLVSNGADVNVESNKSLRKQISEYLPDFNDPNNYTWTKIIQVVGISAFVLTTGYITYSYFHGDLGTLEEIGSKIKSRYNRHVPNSVKDFLHRKFFWLFESPSRIPNWKDMSIRELKQSIAEKFNLKSDAEIRKLVEKGTASKNILDPAKHYIDLLEKSKLPLAPQPDDILSLVSPSGSEKTIIELSKDSNYFTRFKDKITKLLSGEKYKAIHTDSPFCICPDCVRAKLEAQANQTPETKSEAFKKLQDYVLGDNPKDGGNSSAPTAGPSDTSSSAPTGGNDSLSSMAKNTFSSNPEDVMHEYFKDANLGASSNETTPKAIQHDLPKSTFSDSDSGSDSPIEVSNTLNQFPKPPSLRPNWDSKPYVPNYDLDSPTDSGSSSDSGSGSDGVITLSNDKKAFTNIIRQQLETERPHNDFSILNNEGSNIIPDPFSDVITDTRNHMIEQALEGVRDKLGGVLPDITATSEPLLTEQQITDHFNVHGKDLTCPRCVIAAIEQSKYDFNSNPTEGVKVLLKNIDEGRISFSDKVTFEKVKASTTAPIDLHNPNNPNNPFANHIPLVVVSIPGSKSKKGMKQISARSFSTSACVSNLPQFPELDDFDLSFEYDIKDLTDLYAVPDLMNQFYRDLAECSEEHEEYMSLNISIFDSINGREIKIFENLPLKVQVTNDQFHFACFLKYKINNMIFFSDEISELDNVKFRFDINFIGRDEYRRLNLTFDDEHLRGFQLLQFVKSFNNHGD